LQIVMTGAFIVRLLYVARLSWRGTVARWALQGAHIQK
jgi:hypothetical protein